MDELNRPGALFDVGGAPLRQTGTCVPPVRAVTHDFVPGFTLDDSLFLDDYEVALVSYAINDLAGLSGVLHTEGCKRRQPRRRQGRIRERGRERAPSAG